MTSSLRGPIKGEQWKRERTLPSGFYSPNPSSSLESKELAWHPSKPLLVTTGSYGLMKLWDTIDGNLLTNDVYRSSYSDVKDIRWAPDGEFFAAYDQKNPIICDGRTGEKLYSLHSERGLHEQRQGYNYDWQYMFFDPWRPNSKQITTIGKNGILNISSRESGELDQSIDCNVENFYHFSWHPSGRFIAIHAWSSCGASIIDVNNERIIAVLPDRFLYGWLPDGKGIWGRTRDRQNHFIWDAQEMKEELISIDEFPNGIVKYTLGIKTENAWDEKARLCPTFKNVSADGVRYIEVSKEGEAKIFSSESSTVVSTLPMKVNAAAWSSHDGGLLATCAFRGSEAHIWQLQV